MKKLITIAVQKNKTTIYYKIPFNKLSKKQQMHYMAYKSIKKTNTIL